MSQKLSGPMVAPGNGDAPRKVVVLLHGYGADGRDLIGLAAYWRDILPDALFVAPNAPGPCRDNPAGYQWFDIDRDRPEFRLDGVAAARPVVAEFLEDLWRQTGLGPADTILGGFSQGAMMALHVGLTLDRELMGIIGFSGALIVGPGFGQSAGPRPPVCLVHGEFDQVVDPDFSAQATAMLRARGVSVDYHVEEGAGHTITEDGLRFASDFIARIAAPK